MTETIAEPMLSGAERQQAMMQQREAYEGAVVEVKTPDFSKRVLGSLGVDYERSLANLEAWGTEPRLVEAKNTPDGAKNFAELRGRVDAYKDVLQRFGQNQVLQMAHDNVRANQAQGK